MSAHSLDRPPSATEYGKLTERLSRYIEPLRRALDAVLTAVNQVITAAIAVTAATDAGRDGAAELETAAERHAAAEARLREFAPELASLLVHARDPARHVIR